MYNHDSIASFITPSDMAYTMWQLINSYEDWDVKVEREREGMPVDMHKCNTRWTANRKLPAMEDRTDADPGVRFYKACQAWAKRFMTQCPGDFSVAINRKSIELGYFKKSEVDRKVQVQSARRHEGDEEMEVPLFDLAGIDAPMSVFMI